MNYKIIKKEAFKIIGKGKRVSIADCDVSQVISKLWDEAYNDGLFEKLSKLAGTLGLLGICMDHDQGEFTYVIAVEKPRIDVSGDLIEKEISAATWAVFESFGPLPGAIREVWKHIFSEWFPAKGYEHANAPDIEVYPPGDTNDSNYKCEVWVPIIKR